MQSYFKRFFVPGMLAVLVCTALSTISVAAASNSTNSSVTQSYNVGAAVLPSMIVEFKTKDKTSVVPLTSNDVGNMLGVVVPNNNVTLVLTPQTFTSQQVLVASSGHYNVLVSNQSGLIKAGDYLTMSSLPGISMKASSSQPLIVGRALSTFNGSNAISTVNLRDSQNSTVAVAIGRIAVNVQLAPNPLYLKNSNSILVFLTRAEYDVTNKSVSPARTYLSGVLLLVTVFMSGIVLYSGTKNAMISIGRNPLAKSAIGRSMIKTIIAGISVFVAGIAAIYLILNR